MRLSNKVVGVFLSLALVFALGISVAAQVVANKPKTYEGFEVSVISMERMKAWSAGGNRFTPKDEKQEFVVFRLRIRPLEKQKSFALTRDLAGVRSADNKGFNMPLNKYGVAVTAEGTLIELPFTVPIGTQLKSMHLGSVAFDLAQVPEIKPKAAN